MLHGLLLIIFISLVTLYFTQDHISDWLIYYHDSMETLSFTAVIISLVFVAVQSILFVNDYHNRTKRSEREMSYKMARYYCDNILPHLSAVKNLLNNINIQIAKDYLTAMDKQSRFSQFTTSEACTIFGKDSIKKFSKLYQRNYSRDELITFFAQYNKQSKLEIANEWDSILENSSKMQHEAFYKNMQREMYNNVATLFNNMEYFSMYFCGELAMTDNVYMSLHQTFLDFIAVGYLYIAKVNTIDHHEFYKNTISLYNTWQIKSTMDTLSPIKNSIKWKIFMYVLQFILRKSKGDLLIKNTKTHYS